MKCSAVKCSVVTVVPNGYARIEEDGEDRESGKTWYELVRKVSVTPSNCVGIYSWHGPINNTTALGTMAAHSVLLDNWARSWTTRGDAERLILCTLVRHDPAGEQTPGSSLYALCSQLRKRQWKRKL